MGWNDGREPFTPQFSIANSGTGGNRTAGSVTTAGS